MLYDRINLRVDLMMEQGLLEEVEGLYNRGIRDCQSIQAIGYKEIYDYFENRASFRRCGVTIKDEFASLCKNVN